MRLRNPTQTMVYLKNERKREMIALKPGDAIVITDEQFRLSIGKLIQTFGLRWELDDDDLPAGTTSHNRVGTREYYDQHPTHLSSKPDDDIAEIQDVWAAVDLADEGTHPAESMFYTKGAEERTPPQEVRGDAPDELAPPDDGPRVYGALDPALLEGVSADPGVTEEGPDYLRSTSPDIIEGFGGESAEDDTRWDERVPEHCPYSKNQLQMMTKAQLWEITDKIGISSEGTKREVISRIFDHFARS